MISINALTTSYDSKPILNNLNLELPLGEIHGIVGLNGAGKTTLLNAIYGLKENEMGKILYLGHKLTRKQLAYLVTDNYFYPNITGNEYLELFRNPNFVTEKWNLLFGLPLNQLIDNYSTGMKKKLALMGIFKQDKPILMLDEPFNGLDMETSCIIGTLLLKLKETGKTILVTSHVLSTLTSICDQIHYLEGGIIKSSRGKAAFEEFENELHAYIEQKNQVAINQLSI
jgi:ABC-2 type transport system ATP-binding protein